MTEIERTDGTTFECDFVVYVPCLEAGTSYRDQPVCRFSCLLCDEGCKH
jgi:hypothetical protein